MGFILGETEGLPVEVELLQAWGVELCLSWRKAARRRYQRRTVPDDIGCGLGGHKMKLVALPIPRLKPNMGSVR